MMGRLGSEQPLRRASLVLLLFFLSVDSHRGASGLEWSFGVAPAAAAPGPRGRESEEDPAREVPAELAKLLTAAQRALEANDPAATLRILGTYEGEPDPLKLLLEGYAHHDLEAYDAADAAFVQALELDDTLREARLGLARTRVMAQRWSEAVAILKTFVDVDQSPAAEMGLYARAAFERGDLRLASLLVQRGIVRFPDNLPLRRLDVALLLQRRAFTEAVEAALAVLAQRPTDALAWRQLAAAADQMQGEVFLGGASRGASEAEGAPASMQAGPLALAALEAAELTQPEHEAVRLRRAAALFERGALWAAADALQLNRWPQAPESAVPLAVRVHLELGHVEQALAWAERAPDALRGVTQVRVELHRRLRDGGPEAVVQWAEDPKTLPSLPTRTLVEVGRSLPPAEARRWLRYASLRPDDWGTVARAELADL